MVRKARSTVFTEFAYARNSFSGRMTAARIV
jgi:hypothetical protein